MIHRRCSRILRDREEALDATQDVFLQLLSHLESFRGEAQITTWVYAVSTNHCLNRLRARKSRGRALEALERVVASAPAFEPEIQSVQRDFARILLSAVEPRLAQILYHAFCDEMTQVEIAEVMGLSDRTIRTELKRGVEALRSHSLRIELPAEARDE